jgi:hypothetical protein
LARASRYASIRLNQSTSACLAMEQLPTVNNENMREVP